MAKQCVLTIHGVNTDGAWQSTIERVIEPHFESVPIQYPDYQTICKTITVGIFFSLPVILIVLAGSVAAVLFFLAGQLLAAVAAFATMLFGIYLGVLGAAHKRGDVLRRIRVQLAKHKHRWITVEPHLIAHSMGTYLAVNCLDGFSDFGLDRMVLAGSVLPRDFAWHDLKRRRFRSFTEVRNEVGGGDLVVKLVGWLAILIPELGDSGRRGFLEHQRYVHWLDTDHGPCKPCDKRRTRALVHNVQLKVFRHSDAFLTAQHCQELWLPFLWGYEPFEYMQFREMCLAVVKLEQDEEFDSCEAAVEELASRKWSWLGGQTLVQRIGAQLDKSGIVAHLHLSPKEARYLTMVLMCRLFHRALLEREKYPAWRAEVVKRLHPRIVLTCALRLVAR